MAPAKKKPWKTGASSGHITNLKQSILETFDINVHLTQVNLCFVSDANSPALSANRTAAKRPADGKPAPPAGQKVPKL
jgi:hypothetical protein